MARTQIQTALESMIAIKKAMLDDDHLLESTAAIADAITEAFRAGNKVLFCGNGGSAADAQHIAAELAVRYGRDRAPLDAQALHVNGSALTAAANDLGYDYAFARALQACGRKGDILVALSTSGNSVNVLHAVHAANERDMLTIGLTGRGGAELARRCQLAILVPSTETPRIQECHIAIGHIICDIVERELFPNAPAT